MPAKTRIAVKCLGVSKNDVCSLRHSDNTRLNIVTCDVNEDFGKRNVYPLARLDVSPVAKLLRKDRIKFTECFENNS